jgi:hypothetical protein
LTPNGWAIILGMQVHKVDEPTLQRHPKGHYEVGLRCSLTGAFFWKQLKARRLATALEESVGAVLELLRESADRWNADANIALAEEARLRGMASRIEAGLASIKSTFPIYPKAGT